MYHFYTRSFISSIVVLFHLVSILYSANEWTRFRGPNGSGVSATKIPSKWNDKSYQYKIKLPGTGIGSPIIRDNKIYLLTADEESGTRTAL